MKKNQDNHINSFNTNNQSFLNNEKNNLITFVSIAIIISGGCCFCLKSNWTTDFYLIPKTLIFLLISVSLCFLILFGLLDFFNFLISCRQQGNSLALVETKDQTVTLIILSIIMGTYFGLIYSIIKIEKQDSTVNSQLQLNQHLSMPFGILCGIIWILVNEVLIMNSGSYKIVNNNEEDPFSEEI